jgi:hypothetical protein
MTRDELWEKFRDCTGNLRSRSKSETVLQMLTSLDTLKRLSTLMDILTYGRKEGIGTKE